MKIELKIPCIYDETGHFYEDLASVKLNGKWGFINKNGKEMIKCVYDTAYGFSEGLGMVQQRTSSENTLKYGFIDKKGKEVIKCVYDDAGIFSEGLGLVKYVQSKRTIKSGFIDKNGNEVIKCIYDDASLFSEGLAQVKRKKKNGGL